MQLLRSLGLGSNPSCPHRPAELPTPRAEACEGCGSTRSLRMCATCGHVGCCDSQAGHARAHYGETGHEVMASMPVGAGFTWCYVDDRYVG